MTTANLDPQLLAAYSKAKEIEQRLGPAAPGINGMRRMAALGRQYWNEGGPSMFETSHRLIPGPFRNVSVARYRPHERVEPSPVFIFLHGGGFAVGNELSNDRQMREIAAAWGGVVISADYVHVPEHVFPDAVTEVGAVLQWVRDHGNEWGLDPENIAIGGLSAGANIAFTVAAGLGHSPWLKAAVGIVGAFDFDTDAPSMKMFGGGELFPSRDQVQKMFEAYVPDTAARTDPRTRPALFGGSAFPPSFLAAAEFDVFRDSSGRLATVLEEAGRLRAHKIYPAMGHLFFGFSRDVPKAAECVSDVAAFLASQLPVCLPSAR